MSNQITIRMPKELLAKWLAALRSGEYAQGRLALNYAGAYCCLGVLQHVADGCVTADVDAQLPPLGWLEDRGIEFVGAYCDGRSAYLPSLMVTANVANDSGKTFTEIADAIEACAEGV